MGFLGRIKEGYSQGREETAAERKAEAEKDKSNASKTAKRIGAVVERARPVAAAVAKAVVGKPKKKPATSTKTQAPKPRSSRKTQTAKKSSPSRKTRTTAKKTPARTPRPPKKAQSRSRTPPKNQKKKASRDPFDVNIGFNW